MTWTGSRHRGAPTPEARHGRRRRPWVLAGAAVLVAVLAWVAWSVGGALSTPGSDTLTARLAEWGRDHGLGVVVLDLEKLQYALSPPARGGAPPPGVLSGRSSYSVHSAKGVARRAPTSPVVVLRRPIRTFAHPALQGEGVWRDLVSVHGQPAVQATYLRPDSVHTSYLTGVVRMSSRLLRFSLHPGYDQPGGTWPVPDWIPPGRRAGLVATWNGAFKLADARGGFYLDGRTAGTLTNGAASEVFYRDGTMTVGRWNREVRMTPAVVGVRQNLGMLIDHGRILPDVNSSATFHWGLTLGGAYYVYRSGVGVTANGDLVYASGNALSAQTLARILKAAGCVRAMELDINPAWVSFMSYHAGRHPGDPKPKSLLPDYQRPADRYYQPTSRDFVTVYAR